MTDQEVIEYCNKNCRKKWKNRNSEIIEYLLNMNCNDFNTSNIFSIIYLLFLINYNNFRIIMTK